MSTKTDNFINAIAPLAVNEYLSREKWILPSVCIAQAALESGWNLQAKSVFGIKGEGFKATTTEYYNGNKTVIEDSFRAYPDLASSVIGYYDFLRDTPRYEKALNNTDYKDTVDKLIHTTDGHPYATAPNYIETVISIIEDFDLTRFDSREVKKPVEESKYHEYVVVRGDSYWAIAEKFGNASRFQEIQELNGSKPLYAGNIVKVPMDMVKTDTKEEVKTEPKKNYKEYTVKAGDGFWAIADREMGDGSKMYQLANFNGMTIESTIFTGQVLKIPM